MIKSILQALGSTVLILVVAAACFIALYLSYLLGFALFIIALVFIIAYLIRMVSSDGQDKK